VFLNQVHGPRPGHLGYSFPRLNKKDGCFQCSLVGPDSFLFPPAASLFAESETVLPNFCSDFLTRARTSYIYCRNGRMINSRLGDFRRHVVLPILPLCMKSKKKYRPKKSGDPKWTAPPPIFTFDGDTNPYTLVYVEDTACHLSVPARLKKGQCFAIPHCQVMGAEKSKMFYNQSCCVCPVPSLRHS
jgi:hypothetical protein